MTERNTAGQTQDNGRDHGRKGSVFSPATIIVAALVAATTALLRPFAEASTESAVLVAVLLSTATTTSKGVYTALVDKFKHGYRDRRWRPLLLAGLLAGLAACLIGISVVSGVELAVGKEPSISPNGTPIMPNIVGSEPGSQPPEGGQKSKEKTLIWYFSDVDHDRIGDRIGERGIASPTLYELGTQPLGWVEQDEDNCPYVANADQKNTYGDKRGDACEPIPGPKPPK